MKIYGTLDTFKSFWLFLSIGSELTDIVTNSELEYSEAQKVKHSKLGSIKFLEAHILRRLLQQTKPKNILEVGSFLGLSTRWILESSTQWDAKVTSIDPNIRHRIFDDPSSYLRKLNKDFYPANLDIINGFFGSYGDYVYHCYENFEPKINRDRVDEILSRIPTIDGTLDRKYDFIFIDGSHTYKNVIQNFEIALELLNTEGIIAFHDVFTWKGVRKALREIRKKHKDNASVEIYGSFANKVLKTFAGLNKKLSHVSNDGIGVFRSKA